MVSWSINACLCSQAIRILSYKPFISVFVMGKGKKLTEIECVKVLAYRDQ